MPVTPVKGTRFDFSRESYKGVAMSSFEKTDKKFCVRLKEQLVSDTCTLFVKKITTRCTAFLKYIFKGIIHATPQ